jgi:hypothetical protein
MQNINSPPDIPQITSEDEDEALDAWAQKKKKRESRVFKQQITTETTNYISGIFENFTGLSNRQNGAFSHFSNRPKYFLKNDFTI